MINCNKVMVSPMRKLHVRTIKNTLTPILTTMINVCENIYKISISSPSFALFTRLKKWVIIARE